MSRGKKKRLDTALLYQRMEELRKAISQIILFESVIYLNAARDRQRDWLLNEYKDIAKFILHEIEKILE